MTAWRLNALTIIKAYRRYPIGLCGLVEMRMAVGKVLSLRENMARIKLVEILAKLVSRGRLVVMRSELKTHGFAPFSLQNMAGRLQCFKSQERGNSLIEMMMVVSIMSVLSLGMLYLLTALMNSTAQAQQSQVQAADVEATSDSVSSKLTSTLVGDVGRLTASGTTINPVSLSGDQMVFTDANGRCYRIAYVQHSNEEGRIWEGEAPTCSAIAAVRGPNEIVPGTEDSYYTLPTDQNYDPFLDNFDNYEVAHVIASNVSLSQDGNVALNADNAPFTYYDETENRLLDLDAQANSASDNPLYDSPALLPTVSTIVFHVWIGSNLAPGPITPKPQELKMKMTLNM